MFFLNSKEYWPCIFFENKHTLFISTLEIPSNGLFQKISTSPLWTTLNWVPKNFRTSKKDSCSFHKIPESADSKSGGIPEFHKNFYCFPGIPVKIYKILVKVMDFQSYLLSISYRISMGGCVDIFWNSPITHKIWIMHTS